MKALFMVGIIALILGVASLVVPIPHTEDHGIKVGDTSIGVQTTDKEHVSPIISGVLIIGGLGMLLAGRGKS